MPANERLTEIHNAKQRMPLILPPDDVDTWLTGTSEQATDLLLVPSPSELMRALRVSKRALGQRAADVEQLVNKPEKRLMQR